MQRVYTVKLSMLGVQGAQKGAVHEGVIDEIEGWLREKIIPRLNDDQRDKFKMDYVNAISAGDWILKASRRQGKTGEISNFELVHPDGVRENLLWRTAIRVSYDALNDVTETYLELFSGYSIDMVDTVAADPRPPNLVRRLIEKFPCTSLGSTARVDPLVIEEGSEGAFVNDVLLDPHRHVPCILITTKSETDKPVVNPSNLANDLAGLAIVAYLPRSYQTYAITEILGKDLSCFHGGVRVYRPNFSIDADPYVHSLFIGSSIEMNVRGFYIKLRRTIYDMASVGISRGSVHDKVQKLLQQELAEKTYGMKNINELKKEISAKNDEIHDLKERLDTANDSVVQLGKRVSDLEIQISIMESKAAPSSVIAPPGEDEISRLSTAEEVINLAENSLERITFHPKSRDGSKGYRTMHNIELYRCLVALDGLAAEYYDHGGRLGTTPEKWLKSFSMGKGHSPSKFAPSESQTTMGKYKQERSLSWRKRTIVMEKHFTIGQGDSEGCMHLFWEFDDETRTILIGHVGRHLKYDKGEN